MGWQVEGCIPVVIADEAVLPNASVPWSHISERMSETEAHLLFVSLDSFGRDRIAHFRRSIYEALPSLLYVEDHRSARAMHDTLEALF